MARRKKNVLGLANVLRVFRELPKENLKRLTHALNLGADEIVAKAREAVPVSDPIAGQEHVRDTIRRTGIRVREAGPKNSRGAVVYVYAGRGDDGETDDASFRSEFGRAPDDGGGHPGHHPQSFMFPAYHSVRARVRRRVAREVNAAAKAVVRGRK